VAQDLLYVGRQTKQEIFHNSMGDNESLLKEIKKLKNEIEHLQADEKSVRITQEELEEYQETQIRFRTIFETSSLGNKIIGSDLKILQLNAAMVALLGYDNKEELIGTHILDYTPSEFHPDWTRLQTKLWKEHIPSFRLETCLRKKDGSIIWCAVTSTLFKDQGKTFGYTIIEDITEQYKLRKHREEFISIASHELKTPLTSLQAVIQIMNRIIKKETVITDQLIKLSKSSESYVLKLTSLVGDLLNSTKIQNGQLSLDISRFRFSDLVNKCCKHVRLDGKYDIIYKGDLSLEMDADKNKIDQVIVNLVNNAVKYAPESKEIIIEVVQLDGILKISVTDKGRGIQPDKLPLIFDSYYQVNNEGSFNSGMGLGLYISSEIVKRHGGEIGVISEVGKGSSFWFTIPLGIKPKPTCD